MASASASTRRTSTGCSSERGSRSAPLRRWASWRRCLTSCAAERARSADPSCSSVPTVGPFGRFYSTTHRRRRAWNACESCSGCTERAAPPPLSPPPRIWCALHVIGDDRRPGFRLHLRRLFVAAALKDAVRRAEEHEAAGRRRRARRADREAARLRLRLEELGGSPSELSNVGERVMNYVRPQDGSADGRRGALRRTGGVPESAGEARLRDGDEGTSTEDRSINASAREPSARPRSINC